MFHPSPIVIGVLGCAVFLSACAQTPELAVPGTTPTGEPSTEMGAVNPEGMDGPKADADRLAAQVKVSTNAQGSATISEVDLGNVTQGKYRAPIRGILISPKTVQTPGPLIVVNHLRYPNCSSGVFAYPCPEGDTEYRFDQGMTYLGEHLAEQGYSVLIPDLAAIWIGAETTQPYDQNAMWNDAVRALVDGLRSDMAGTTTIYGTPLAGHIDLDKIGLLVHSRSGTIVDTAISAFGKDHVQSVLAYGPSYDTFDLEHISPPPADIPYLAITGDADRDVGASANLWVGEYLSKPRNNPALVASLPGLGHTAINQTLSAVNIDDRVGCEALACHSPQDHERVLRDVSTQWFNATLREAPTTLPLQVGAPFPDQLAGLDARWLGVSAGEQVRHLGPNDLKPVSPDSAKICRHADPMSPIPIDNACPEPEIGVLESISEVNHLKAATLDVDGVRAASIAIHVQPFGSSPIGNQGAPLHLELGLADGQTWTHTIAPTHPAIANRASEHDNGSYLLGTIRIDLPDQVQKAGINHLTLKSDKPVEVRGIDLVPVH